MKAMSVVYNAYFKGGPNDTFISGMWIGNAVQDNVMFIQCQFNGVKAAFTNCVFIDCDNPPEDESCQYYRLGRTTRLIVQRWTEEGGWR